MATFGSSGIVLKEVKLFTVNTNTAPPDNPIYVVPVGRYAKVSVQHLVTSSANPLTIFRVISGGNTYILSSSVEGGPGVQVIAIRQGFTQRTIPYPSALDAAYVEPHFNKDFMIYGGDILNVNFGIGGTHTLAYHIVAEEYLLPA